MTTSPPIAAEGTRCVLVMGGAGYVGSHVCKALSARGVLPVTFDDLSKGNRAMVKWGPLEVGDVRDRARLSDVLDQHNPGCVMHLAGKVSISESFRTPQDYFSVNVEGTQCLLDVMTEKGIPQLVFSSTAAVYGEPRSTPVNEHHDVNPQCPYAESKLRAERLIDTWSRDGHGRAVTLRYFNAAGADPEGECGHSLNGEAHVIPIAIRAAMARKPFNLFGNDYPTSDGSCVRDFVHVTDLAESHRASLRYLDSGGASRMLNLGAGCGHSINEVLATVVNVGDCELEVINGPRRAGDVMELVASCQMAAKHLNWKPSHSSLERIVRTAWHWESVNH